MISEIAIYPVGREFDAAALQAYLLAQPYAARDEIDPETIMLSDDPGTLDSVIEERRADPSKFSYSAILVGTHAKRVDIAYKSTDVEVLRAFVKWLRKQYDLRFEDADYGGDVTAQVDENLNFLFGEPS